MSDNYKKMPEILKSPLSDFNIDDEFPIENTGVLYYYDMPLEQHWIRKDGRDYINTFFSSDDTRNVHPRMRELVFRIDSNLFLDYQKGKYSFTELVEMSVEDYLVIEYGNEYTKIWSFTLQEIKDLYNGKLPLGTSKSVIHAYEDYYEDVMKPYLVNKIRNDKINSLKL